MLNRLIGYVKSNNSSQIFIVFANLYILIIIRKFGINYYKILELSCTFKSRKFLHIPEFAKKCKEFQNTSEPRLFQNRLEYFTSLQHSTTLQNKPKKFRNILEILKIPKESQFFKSMEEYYIQEH